MMEEGRRFGKASNRGRFREASFNDTWDGSANMAMKNLDFKQLMLDKGEKIGLGLALALMLLLVGIGAVSGFTSDNPAQIAEDIRTKASKIEATLASGPPVSPLHINAGLLKPVETEAVALAGYRSEVDNFVETAMDDPKRKNPELLVPDEFHVEMLRVPVKVLIASPQRDKLQIGVLERKEKSKDPNTSRADTQQYIQNRFTAKQHMRNLARFRSTNDYVAYLQRLQMAEASKEEFELKLVDSRKVDKDSRLAITVQPQRMVIVNAAFPYRKQLDAYRMALKVRSLGDLASSKDLMPQFLPFNVQRRALDANGKVREPWADLDLVGNYAAAFQYQFASEEEDANLKDVIFKGLVMGRPQLARGEYGRPRLNKIDEALNALTKLKSDKGPNATVLSPLERQLDRNSIDPFGKVEAIEDEKGDKKQPPPLKAVNSEPSKTGESHDLLVPEYCLVRFIDADDKLRPGMTYEYRMQIKAANPNFNKPKETLAYPSLAEPKELVSAWWPKEGGKQAIQAKMLPEFYYYGVELDDKVQREKEYRDPNLLNNKDITYFEAHRWLDKVRLDPEGATMQMPVGNWSVATIPIRRGEYIVRTEAVELPIWSPQREAYRLAEPPPPPRAVSPLLRPRKALPGIPIHFAPAGDPDLLVDFEGGKIRQSFKTGEKTRSINVNEDAAVEYLILKADGSLLVRNSRADVKNPGREKSYGEWQKLMQETRQKNNSGGSDNPFSGKN